MYPSLIVRHLTLMVSNLLNLSLCTHLPSSNVLCLMIEVIVKLCLTAANVLHLHAGKFLEFQLYFQIKRKISLKSFLGYAACKNCFETYRYIDSSTANLNSHVCPRVLSLNQLTLQKLSQTIMPPIDQKLLSMKNKKKI